MKRSNILEITFTQNDFIAGFGGYAKGTARTNHAKIVLNVGSILACLQHRQIKEKDIPYIVAETVMHEIIHALEDWAKQKFSHRKINGLLKKYNKNALQSRR